MTDRTVKTLLGAIVLLLFALFVRLTAVTPHAQAQGPAPATTTGPPVMAATNNMVYVLQGNQLSIYYVDLGVSNPFELLKTIGDEKEQEKLLKNAKLRLLLSQDIRQLPADARKAQ